LTVIAVDRQVVVLVEGSEHDHGFLPALRTWHCFGCDPNHAKGLRLRFTAPAPDSLNSEFTLSDDYTGVGSIVHGGIIATIFDDVMMWCLLRHRRRFFVTTEMTQQLLRPALAGQPLRVEARIAEEDGDRMVLEAALVPLDEPGRPLAQGAGTFVPLPPRLLEVVPADQREEMERLFAEFAEGDVST
jgi:acyl-coenzyme A thioesterase PaaI-like protein